MQVGKRERLLYFFCNAVSAKKKVSNRKVADPGTKRRNVQTARHGF
jgi:hypothetical protein